VTDFAINPGVDHRNTIGKVAPGIFAQEGRCWRFIYENAAGHAGHCMDPVEWTGRWKSRRAGRRAGVARGTQVSCRGPDESEVLPTINPGREKATYKGATMIVLGLVLMLIGFIAKIPILWSLGILVAVVGVVLMLLGMAGREIGGRRHYY
jgi:hypothetical protein